MEKYNEQMLPKRARSQRQAVGKALASIHTRQAVMGFIPIPAGMR